MFERTSHMPRNMVIGKLKYLIGLASGTIIHPLGRSRFYFCPDVRVQSGRTLLSGRVSWIHGLERKGNSSVGESKVDPHACALGSPGQVEIRFGIVRLSRHETA